jgi:hypothetical protein
MLISPQLKQKIESNIIEMRVHPERALILIHRKSIYDQLNLGDPLRDNRTFKWLAVITARQTLSIWHQMRSDHYLPEHLINLAEGRMNNTISVAMANTEVDKAWKRIENLGVVNNDASISEGSFYIYMTAFEALMETLGRDSFKDVIIDEHDTDSDLDPWSSDTALWAAAAHAGRVGDPNSDLQKRQNFWEWWLMEAIPNAINISTGNV